MAAFFDPWTCTVPSSKALNNKAHPAWKFSGLSSVFQHVLEPMLSLIVIANLLTSTQKGQEEGRSAFISSHIPQIIFPVQDHHILL